MQADNYFKVRSGKDSVEFPFVTDYASDAARAERAASDAHALYAAAAMGHGLPEPVISVYDATHFPDYPQVGDWADEDLRGSDEADDETIH